MAIFALQFALAHGANCIVISSDDRKLAKLEQLGPIHKINRTKNPDWHVKVAELTNQLGAEHILELVAGDNLNKSISAVSFHGNIYIIGVLNGYETKINIQPLLYKKPKLHGIGVGPKQTLIDVSKAIETLELKPHIDQVYAFQDAEKAFAHLYRGAFGKIVIRVSEDS